MGKRGEVSGTVQINNVNSFNMEPVTITVLQNHSNAEFSGKNAHMSAFSCTLRRAFPSSFVLIYTLYRYTINL